MKFLTNERIMKIGFLAAKRGEKEFKDLFETIINHLTSKGHEVVHSMDTPLESIVPMNYAQRQEWFFNFYHKLEECDLVFAETSLQSTQVGFGLAQLRMKGHPVISLSQGEVTNQFFPKGEVYSNIENMMACHYDKNTIKQVLDEALAYMEPHLDKRFTIIFPANLLAKVEERSHDLHVPKSVYIRQLIEKDIHS